MIYRFLNVFVTLKVKIAIKEKLFVTYEYSVGAYIFYRTFFRLSRAYKLRTITIKKIMQEK
jgi:hypothetical protein